MAKRLSLIAVLAGVSMLPGCGTQTTAPQGTAAPATPTTTTGTATAPTDSNSGTSGSKKPESTVHARNELWTDENGQKWFGTVPLDAFFDKPYEVAANQGSVNPNTPPVVPDPVPEPDPVEPKPDDPGSSDKPSETTAAPDATADSWDTLITAATLDEEVKSIRTFLQENVSSVGTYNSSMMMIPPRVATLAALAEVARQQTESVSWKDDAAYIRNLAKKMNENPLQRGAKDQKRLLELFESMSDTLNRSRPAGLEEPPEGDSFAESADMRMLMKRMEESEKLMKTEVASEAALGTKKDLVQHEAAIMATLAKVVTHPGFGYGDDAEFVGYGKEVIDASQALKSAADGGDFSGFQASMSKVALACQNCHSKYKND